MLFLKGFRVRMYRSVLDSGPIPVFPLTALVGQVQSGKTSLLHALAGMAAEAPRPYSIEQDWPRGKKRLRSPRHIACSAEFRLEGAGVGPRTTDGAGVGVQGLRVGKTYGGNLIAEAWAGNAEDDAPMMPDSGSEEDRQRMCAFAEAHMPRFLLAEQDALIPGAVASDVLANPGLAEQTNGIAALSWLLRAAGMPPDELATGAELRRLRECGEQIRAVFQERGFAPGLFLSADRGRVVVSLDRGGRHVPADQLPRDERMRLTVEMRLAASMMDGDRQTVLLLDGPGRSFRREKQGHLRALLDSYACAGVSVIYTARMPFEIEPQHPEQVLVLAPGRTGAMVNPCENDSAAKWTLRAALGMTGRRSFSIDDLSLVVEGRTDARILRALDRLLVKSGDEGLPSDLMLTSAQGAEGVAAVSTFLGRQGLGAIALFDSDVAGLLSSRHLLEAALEEPPIERLEILQLGEAAGMGDAIVAIEGLFPLEAYIDATRTVCGVSDHRLIDRALTDAEGNPAARLSKIFQSNGRKFPKGRVIDLLAERLEGMSSSDQLPEGMGGPVANLFAAIRSAADRLRDARS